MMKKMPKFDNLFLIRILELKIGILCVLYWSQKITKNVVRQPKRLQKIAFYVKIQIFRPFFLFMLIFYNLCQKAACF